MSGRRMTFGLSPIAPTHSLSQAAGASFIPHPPSKPT